MSRDIAKALRTEFTPENPLPVAGSGGGAGNSSATSSNQDTQIMRETEIRDRIGATAITGTSMPSGGVGLFGWLSAIWKAIPSNTTPVAVNVLSTPTPATIYGAGTQNIETTSLLAVGATYTGPSRNTSLLRSSILGWVVTDQAGILTIEQSTDNTVWRRIFSLNTLGKADPTLYEAKLYAQYYRLKFTNTGGSAQTVMQLISNTYNNTSSTLGGGGDATASNQIISNTILGNIDSKLMPLATLTYYLGTSNGANLKASAGNIYAITYSNSNSVIRYFQIFNKASAPAASEIPIISFPAYASDGFILIGQDILGGGGMALSVGVSWGFSTTRLIFTPAPALDLTATVRWA
jgi:hypothetical protein